MQDLWISSNWGAEMSTGAAGRTCFMNGASPIEFRQLELSTSRPTQGNHSICDATAERNRPIVGRVSPVQWPVSNNVILVRFTQESCVNRRVIFSYRLNFADKLKESGFAGRIDWTKKRQAPP